MIKSLVFGFGGVVAALGVVIGFVVFMRASATLKVRPLTLVIPLILFTAGLGSLMSGRNLNIPIDFDVPVRGALVVWTQRFVSLFILASCVDQWLSVARRRTPGLAQPSPFARLPWALLISFGLFWLGSVILPAWFGVERRLSHEYAYAMLIGVALLASSSEDAAWTLRLARDSLLAFAGLSLLLIPVAPALTIETNYTQGLIPGLPRLAGLAPHAISLAMMAFVGMVCLYALPLRRPRLNQAAWLLLGLTLFLAQSKSVWISALLCLGLMAAVRTRPAMIHWAANPGSRLSVALALGLLMLLMLMAALAVTAGGVAGRVIDFMASSQGQEAMTMTGRDVIWRAALDEFALHPVFGYGPALFGIDHREYIDMPFATHGHNQFVDSLGRTGLLGTSLLTLYLLVLTVGALRYAERSGGVTLALWLFLILRSVSEVPFDLYGYGPELIPHYLLLAVITGCRLAAMAQPTSPASRPLR